MKLLPRARLSEVVRGRAPVVGARCNPEATRGWISPVEARVLMGIEYEDLAEAERRYLDDDAPGRPIRDAGVVARALLARLWAPPIDGLSATRPKIVSAKVHNVTVDEAVDAIFAAPQGPFARLVHFVHAHALNLATFDPQYAKLLAKADMVLPDGIGVRLAARLVGVSMRHNINGTDLLPVLCRVAADRRVPLVLIGGAEGVARECADKLTAGAAGLQVPLVSHGYLRGSAADEVVAQVRRIGRCVVLVGMGTPRQERWAWAHLRDLQGAAVLTVGGLFDFYSGRIPRAPIAWRELGLEWLFRLRQEPARLTTRYLVGNPLFLALALKQRLREGRAKEEG